MGEFKHRHMLFDFHTSGDIEDIGKYFDADKFVNYLIDAKVERITIPAKCHHSWCYYPTKIGCPHPHLTKNLCGEVYQKAKKAGIKVIIYMPVSWSEGDAVRHPEWLSYNKDGKLLNHQNIDFEGLKDDDFRPYYLWKNLCINTGYRDYCLALEREIISCFPDLDGMFFDIMFRHNCYCPVCRKEMEEKGIDIENDKSVQKFYDEKWYLFAEELKNTLLNHNKNGEVFFNGGADMNKSCWHDLHTHIEIEDLPTAWGGYDKMPIRAKYFHRKGKNYVGMTGKFHSAWGEFGGFKNKEALKYEVAQMMSYGAGASVGTQIHPSGIIENNTFEMVKHAYTYAEKIDEFCFEMKNTSKLGVAITFDPLTDEGVSKVLLDSHIDFDIVLENDCLDDFDVIILPSGLALSDKSSEDYRKFLRNGGKLVIVGNGGLVRSSNNFIPEIPLDYIGKSEDTEDYVSLRKEFSDFSSPFLCYDSSYKVKVNDGVILADIKRPYFKRTMKRFCSHYVVPYRENNEDYPALVQGENFIYISHDIFTMYLLDGAQIHRDYFVKALNRIYNNPVLKVKLGSFGRTSLSWQYKKNRYVLHLLYGTPVLRGKYEILEDFPPIYNTSVEIRTDKKVKGVTLKPQNIPVEYEINNGVLKFNVKEFTMHQIVVIDCE